MRYWSTLTGDKKRVWNESGEDEHIGWVGDEGEIVVFRADGLRSDCSEKCPNNHRIDVRNILKIPKSAANQINYIDETADISAGEDATQIEEEWQAAIILEEWLGINRPEATINPTESVSFPRSRGGFTI